MNADSSAFIIHVPELRHYTSDAQQSITELAYITACQLLDDSAKPGPRRLAIATCGALLFDTVLLGDYTPEQAKPLASVTKATHEGATAKVLYPFFATASNDSTPAP